MQTWVCAIPKNCGVAEKVNLTSSLVNIMKLKGKEECNNDNLCAFDNGQCIPKEFWCNGKGKFGS
jgi:hypothetical protein